ncbi:hypothetical protein Hanom_Chr07g00596261 [Helianthus anomalus]
MIEAWWIRHWYFLYISASVMLKNVRSTCHAGFRCFVMSDVPEAWWIRCWYFLYISVSDMLPNFVQHAMRRSWGCGVESIGIYVILVES